MVPDTGYQLGPKGSRLTNLVHKDPDCPIGINGDQNGTRWTHRNTVQGVLNYVPDINQNEHVGSFQIVSNKSGWWWQQQVASREGLMLHNATNSSDLMLFEKHYPRPALGPALPKIYHFHIGMSIAIL